MTPVATALLLLLSLLVLSGCASRHEGYCGGAFESVADLERIHGRQTPDPNTRVARY